MIPFKSWESCIFYATSLFLFLPHFPLKGRPLREQQEVAAAVIQRCYRKYKQVSQLLGRHGNVSYSHSIQTGLGSLVCGLAKSTTSSAWSKDWLWIVLIKNQREMFQKGKKNKQTKSHLQLMPQNNFCSHRWPLSGITCLQHWSDTEEVICVWNKALCLSHFTYELISNERTQGNLIWWLVDTSCYRWPWIIYITSSLAGFPFGFFLSNLKWRIVKIWRSPESLKLFCIP